MLGACLGLFSSGWAFTLAERNQSATCVVAIRPEATFCERRAAAELIYFVQCLTGVKLPLVGREWSVVSGQGGESGQWSVVRGQGEVGKRVVSGQGEVGSGEVVSGQWSVVSGEVGSNTYKRVIWVGAHDKTNWQDLGDEGFCIKADKQALWIVSGPGRGALYGVYEVLERFGGCAWYADDWQVLPKLEKLEVPNGFEVTERPAFALRKQGRCNRRGRDWYWRNKLNDDFNGENGGESPFRFDPVLGKCHTFNALVPPQQYFATHPEYFAMVDGMRELRYSQLCLTNPEVLRIVTEKVLERIRISYPKGIRYYGISQNDWLHCCTCDECKAINQREESRAATQIRFVNQVAEVVEKQYPDVVIQTLAYCYTRRAPKTLKARRNVQVCVCTIECDFARSLEESRARENRWTRDSFKRWAQGERPLSVWDYSGDFAFWFHPFPNIESLQKNIAFYHSLGVDQLYEMDDGGSVNDVWTDIRAWLVAKWMWNPSCDSGALYTRVFQDNFGPAANEMRTYFNLLHHTPRDSKRLPMGCFANILANDGFTPALEKGVELFEQARVKVEGTPYAARVARAQVGLDITRSLRGWGRPILCRDVGKIDKEAFASQQAGVKRALPLLDSMTLSSDRERTLWCKNRLRDFMASSVPTKRVKRLNLEEWQFLGENVYSNPRRVADKQAKDGWSVWLSSTNGCSIAWLDLRGLILDADGEYRLRVRVKAVSPKQNKIESNKGAESSELIDENIPWFRAGVYNRRKEKSLASVILKRNDVIADRYVWYQVGTFTPTSRVALWIAPGDVDIYMDCAELVQVK